MKANKLGMIAVGSVFTAGLLFSFTTGDEKGKMKRYTVFHQKDGVKKQFDTLIPMSSRYTVENFLKDKGISTENVKTIQLSELRPPMHEMEEELVWKAKEGDGKRVEIRVEDENGVRKISKIVDGKEVPITEEELKEMREHHHQMMRERHAMKPGMVWNSEEGEQVEIKVEMDENGNKKITKMVNGKEVPLTDEEKEHLEKMKQGHRQIMFRGEEGNTHEIKLMDPEGEEVQIRVEVSEEGEVKTTKIVDGKEVELSKEEREKMKQHHREHRILIEKEMEGDENGQNQDVKMKVEVDEKGEMKVEKWVNGEKVEVTPEELEKIKSNHTEEHGEHIFIHQLEMEKAEHDKMREIHHMKREMHLMQLHSDEDYTVVLVEENVSKNKVEGKSAGLQQTVSDKGEISVFPNPSSGVITIAFEQGEKEKTTIQVMDVTGKVVFKENLGKFSGSYKKEVNLKEFGAGTYVVEIATGEKRTTKKVLIQ